MLIDLDLTRAIAGLDFHWNETIDSLARGILPPDVTVDDLRADLITSLHKATHWRDLLDHYARAAHGTPGDELQQAAESLDVWTHKLNKALAALAELDDIPF